jgi:hypothetical protein
MYGETMSTAAQQDRLNAASPRQVEFIFWLALLVLTAGMAVFSVPGLQNDRAYAFLGTFIPGEVARPFVYRALLPLLAEIGWWIAPLEPMYHQYLSIYLSLVGFVIGLRRLMLSFWQPTATLTLVALASIPLIGPFLLMEHYPYDLPMLCLFTWGLVWLAQQRWRWFLICYSVACFNKETTIFLTLIFLVSYYPKRADLPFWRLLLMQLGIFVLVRAALMVIFRDFPGDTVWLHLGYHIQIYREWPWLTLTHLLGVSMVGVVVARNFHQKPFFLRQALLVTLPLMTVLFFLFGFPFEIRIFFEVYPLLFLLAIPPQVLNRQT